MDIMFLVDISGSMEGDRLANARRALSSCLSELTDNDTFNVWMFHTTCARLSSTPRPGTSGWKAKANQFIAAAQADGGTDLDGALIEALTDSDHRNSTVVFLSDGEPTVGETEIANIVQDVRIASPGGRPILTVAVDDTPTTPLLDNLARRTGGICVPAKGKGKSTAFDDRSLRSHVDQMLSGRTEGSVEDEYLIVTGLGGCMEVGRSCFLVESTQFQILIDCGIRQPSGVPAVEGLVDPRSIDAVIITHVHADHIGYLQLLVRAGFAGRVFGTGATRDLAEIMLKDDPVQEALGYGDEEADAALSFWHEVESGSVIRDNDLMLRFLPAGHVLGALSVEIVFRGHRIAYTGDIGSQSFFLPPYETPRPGADLLLIETTYNDHDNAPIAGQAEQLVALAEDITVEGGTIVIPCFAVGRAQEVLLAFQDAVEKGRLSEIPIYVAGMICRTNLVHNSWTAGAQITNSGFITVRSMKFPEGEVGKRDVVFEPCLNAYGEPILREDGEPRYRFRDDPRIIVTTAGMALGAAEYFLDKLGGEEENCVVLVGYQAAGSPGRDLLDGTYERKCGEPFLMRVEKIGMSAHAGAGELQAYIQRSKPRRVLLVHGEGEGLADFVRHVRRKTRDAEIMVPGEPYVVFGRRPRLARTGQLDWRAYNIPTILPESLEDASGGARPGHHGVFLSAWHQTWASTYSTDLFPEVLPPRHKVHTRRSFSDPWAIPPQPLLAAFLPSHLQDNIVALGSEAPLKTSQRWGSATADAGNVPTWGLSDYLQVDFEPTQDVPTASSLGFVGEGRAPIQQENRQPVRSEALLTDAAGDLRAFLDSKAAYGRVRSPLDFATASLPNIDAFFPPAGAWLPMPPATAGQWFDFRGAPGFAGPTIHVHWGPDPLDPWYSIKDPATGEVLARGFGDTGAYVDSLLPSWFAQSEPELGPIDGGLPERT